jgi:DNA polymerase-3 subunit gamma/tau
VQVLYQVALLGRRDLPLAPDEFAGFSMALLRMLSFLQPGSASRDERPAAATTPSRASPSAPPAKAVSPPAVQGAATAVAKSAFDGDWTAFVERAGLTGMAGMVARHGELVAFENGHLELVVPETHRMYAEKAYLDKLKAELAPHFGAIRISVRVGTTAGKSVAAARSKEMEERQASAAEAIEEDPFVRELVRDLGAEVVPSSIRPAGEPANGTNTGKR